MGNVRLRKNRFFEAKTWESKSIYAELKNEENLGDLT